jgi:nucleotidyltransferase/DNA polymerase involved in DNA repair
MRQGTVLVEQSSMERFLVVRCPSLVPVDEHGRHARGLADVLAVLQQFSARPPQVVAPGQAAVATRGPSRYFGGDPALAKRVHAKLTGQLGLQGSLGVADGLFAAVLAARLAEQHGRAILVVPPGESPAFLAPWPVKVLGHPELAELLARLGVASLGQLAALPAASVAERFGPLGLACWRAAAGKTGELPGLRQPVPGLPTASGSPTAPAARQRDLFGAQDHAGRRAARAIQELQALLGPEAVLQARLLRTGRTPASQARLVLAGAPAPTTTPSWPTPSRTARPARPTEAPWPGRLPAPAPALVLQPPCPAQLTDHQGDPVRVSATGELSDAPAWLHVTGPGRPTGGSGEQRWRLTSWAGPWPFDERWWTARRRRAYLQVVATDRAFLVLQEGRRWWLEGIYD